jgi:hypothetical protein
MLFAACIAGIAVAALKFWQWKREEDRKWRAYLNRQFRLADQLWYAHITKDEHLAFAREMVVLSDEETDRLLDIWEASELYGKELYDFMKQTFNQRDTHEDSQAS